MTTNFRECAKRFAENSTLRETWGWHGKIIGIDYNSTTQISREGCIYLCGNGAHYYPWKDVSGVITTWILPIIGVLLQAPFESNATQRTLLAITRWVGSPIASISYVLWNIKVSAKAAMMVDMAVKYDETPIARPTSYTLKPTVMSKDLQKEAEGLLRITLFSKDLVLTDTDKTLRQMRRILAREVREMRRRGTVPVFISIMWFLFAFALSIQDAFGDLGNNSTAHDLALGCLLAWFPVLIMGSIVDRNPIAAEAIRKKLSTLVDHVRHALRDKQHRDEFIKTFRDQPDYHELKCRIESVADKGEYMEEFFVDFAGQARIRWHYGAAHAILSDIEDCYIERKGRNWLANEREARASLVLGPVNEEGLVWFDVREFWQVLSAIIIVAGSCGGAFILSYFTPTVGLGCRSGGYTIFFAVALGLLIVEMTVWMFLSPYEFDALCSPWLVMGLSMFYITVEWCQQSFLSTEDYEDAMKGLRMTRAYRSLTLFARRTSRVTMNQLEKLALAIGLIKKRKKTLMWTRHHTWNPLVPRRTSSSGRDHLRGAPSIELTPYDNDRVPDVVFETPAMAHSLFPPAITPRRTRNESDASLDPLDLPGRPRTSGDSSTPPYTKAVASISAE
ncbi:unnamed protein product [Alternaria alternata]